MTDTAIAVTTAPLAANDVKGFDELEEASPRIIVLSTGTELEVPFQHIQHCAALQALCECDRDEQRIPVALTSDIIDQTMKTLFEFVALYHVAPENEREIPCPISNYVPFEKEIPKWQYDFIAPFMAEDKTNELVDLATAANYLQVTPLLNLAAATMSVIMRSMTPEMTRKRFNIPHDLTPEEEKEIIDQNQWVSMGDW